MDLQTLERKIDDLSAKLDRYMTGERGTNGIFGRLQALEIAEENRRNAINKLWAAVVAVGAAALKSLWS